jgi:hypothetical protein
MTIHLLKNPFRGINPLLNRSISSKTLSGKTHTVRQIRIEFGKNWTRYADRNARMRNLQSNFLCC